MQRLFRSIEQAGQTGRRAAFSLYLPLNHLTIVATKCFLLACPACLPGEYIYLYFANVFSLFLVF